jgi:hypothetical protein
LKEKNKMKKRTINGSVSVQRHYATNGILMSREQKKLIEIPEGTLVEILKVRRQTHLCSVRCIVADEETGRMALGSGRKAVDTCIAIPVANLPKMKIEGVETVASRKKGSKNKPKTPPVVVPETTPANPTPAPTPVQPVPADMPAGIAQADIAPQAPAVEVAQPVAEVVPAAVETPAAEVPAEAAV